MTYEIEINVARKGSSPYWRSLVDENEDTCWWETEEEARAVLVDEARGPDARIIRYDVAGISHPL